MATLIGQRVKVHFNLHRHTWSITALSGPDKGRVIANVQDVTLAGVEFKVSAAGHARSRRLGKRTVHAWCVGEVVEVNASPSLEALTRATYNPARGPHFHVITGAFLVDRVERATFAKTSPEATTGYAWVRPSDF